MKKLLLLSGITALLLLFLHCTGRKKQTAEEAVKEYYISCIDSLGKAAEAFRTIVSSPAFDSAKVGQALITLRQVYKSTEVFTAYFTPLTAKALNGPPIESIDANDAHTTEIPEGLQVIEALLFAGESDKKELVQQTDIFIANLTRLKSLAQQQQYANPQIFDAIREEIFRTTSLGLSGFDAPLLQSSILEIQAVYRSIDQILSIYQNGDTSHDSTLNSARRLVQKAGSYLLTNSDFLSFDRMVFIKTYANTVSGSILACARSLNIELPENIRPLSVDATSLFDYASYNPDYYTSFRSHQSSSPKTTLGKLLFHDPILSSNGIRSCATCHQPDKAFTDGVKTNVTFNGKRQLLRNTPTLVYAGLQPALFYDNRVSYLEDQARTVITNKDEMHGSLDESVHKIARDASYIALFKAAFANEQNSVTGANILNALASYIRSLRPFSSAFDKYMNGDSTQLDEQAYKGFNLFMGKAKCGSCHFMPLFNGAIPPEFREIETEVLGVPVQPGSTEIDTDLGKYNLRKIDLYKFAFKTPTLRNIAVTAPYMHNGVYKTLEEVMDFYNKGGGTGLGIKVDNQSLASDPLHLTPMEIQQVIAFLKTLTDGKVQKQ